MWNQAYFTKLSIIIKQWLSRMQNHFLLYFHQITICITPFPLVKYICGTPLILYLMTCLQAFKQISKDSSSPSVRGQRPLCACALEENWGFRACALRFSSAGCTTFTRRWAPHFYHSAVDSSSQTENLDLYGNFAMFVCDFKTSSDLFP